jgi:hypothetical protein
MWVPVILIYHYYTTREQLFAFRGDGIGEKNPVRQAHNPM